MHLDYKQLSLVTVSFFLIGCGTVSSESRSSDESSSSSSTSSRSITITDDIQVERLGKSKKIKVNVDVGNSTKDLYILLSNHSKSRSEFSSITHNQKIVSEPKAKTIALTNMQLKAQHAQSMIHASNVKVKKLLKNAKLPSDRQTKQVETVVKRSKDVVGHSKNFYLDSAGKSTTLATARKVASNVNTSLGRKTLSIWVSNDSFGSGCRKAKCITQSMVESLANSFLKVGSDNDIYDWVTNIYGEEWNSNAHTSHNELIGKSDEITILLTDIDKDNSPEGGAIGFFWSKDNLKKSSISSSNERIMFYIDSVMFANGEEDWSVNDFWPKEVISTLVHEFQHMIHFYQKTVLLADEVTDTWIDEMLAETTEDILATKIRHTGPRGVSHLDGSAGNSHNPNGRYPSFNASNTRSLTSWSNTLSDYGKVNAFGTFLIRNYGGVKLLHDIMHSTYVDEQAIVNAVHKSVNGSGKTFSDLQREWGIAVLLSDNENLEDLPTYNTGDFTPDTYKGSTYQLGSINFFNYTPKPRIYSSTGTVAKQANYYYKIGTNLRGQITVDLDLNNNTEAILVVK